MKSKDLLDRLGPLSYFDKAAVRQLGLELDIKAVTLDVYISRFLRRKEILSLRKGLYVSGDFLTANKGDPSYAFYLANVIRSPSYVSSWAALQHYDLATEAIREITSVTPKVTRVYKTKVGTFSYQSMRRDLFTDFVLTPGKFGFLIATPAKALFDLLYSRTRQFRTIRPDGIMPLVRELRIDIGEMPREDRSRFRELVRRCFAHE